jgi:Domain of unknown function (DUF4168)
MAEFRNTGNGGTVPDISEETVSKVGRAVGQIALIREAYREGVAELDSDGEKQELAERAEAAAVKAISEQGLSVMEYNHVVASADNNPDLEERLLAAAQAD